MEKNTIMVLPTDTLYGIVGKALEKKTVEKIYTLKGRNPKKPCIILISSLDDLKLFGIKKLEPKIENFLHTVWPGPTSVILPIPKTHFKKLQYLHRGTNTLAFRLPKRKDLITLIKKTGPLVAPSANPEGLVPAKNIREAKKYFRDKVFYKNNRKGSMQPSRLVSITKKGMIKILRK